MKPTLEQLQEWRAMAYRYADKQTGDYNEADEIAQEKFAELAAQWGASQAQQEPCADYRAMYLKVRDELAALQQAQQTQQTTEPLGFQIRRAIAAEDELRATKQTLEHAYAALQKVADAQAAIEEPELPEAVDIWLAEHCDTKAVSETTQGAEPVNGWSAAFRVYTAAQMQAFADAKVREAMAQQSADVKRYRWLKCDGRAMAVDAFQGKYRIVDMSCDLVVTDWCDSFDAAIDAAMQGGQK